MSTKQNKTFDLALYPLAQHSIMEASAGAGKTYTIEHLVVRLLLEKELSLEQILLVTYTEKAAGELKERIGSIIRKMLGERKFAPLDNTLGTKEIKVLERASAGLDQASIYTIHGFCQRVLSQYGYEAGELGNYEMVDDEKVYERLIHDFYRSHLSKIMDKIGPGQSERLFFARLCELHKESFEKTAMGILKKSLGLDSILTLPPFNPDYLTLLRHWLSGWESSLFRTREQLKDNIYLKRLEWSVLDILSKTKTAKFKRIYESLYSFFREEKFDLERFYALFEFLKQEKIGQAAYLEECVKKEYRKPELESYRELVSFVRETDQFLRNSFQELQGLEKQLLLEMINWVALKAPAYKKDKRLQSYQDMISRLHRVLCRKKNHELLDKLRKDYCYAFIDEFQDTDNLQWEIFKSIFLEAPGQYLYVIGDPKQAIYAFRGADIRAYWQAKHEMRAMGISLVNLSDNNRSTQPLIKVFNQLFTSRAWFSQIDADEGGQTAELIPEEGIKYVPALYPLRNVERDRHVRLPLKRKALTVFDFECKEKKKAGEEISSGQARAIYYQLLAREIKNLLGEGLLLPEEGRGERKGRPATYKDMAVLVRSRKEGELVEKHLKRGGIPATFYKKNGLYASREALEISFVLRYLAGPGEQSLKKMLMTRFFDNTPENLCGELELSGKDSLKKVLDRWQLWAKKRQWPPLFHSLLSETGIWKRHQQTGPRERQLTNYLHIFENLYTAARGQKLSIQELALLLLSYRQKDLSGEEDFDLQRLDCEADRVQILTLHASKGLEFPVVFLAGGFSEAKTGPFYEYYVPGERRKMFDLQKGAEGKKAHEEESREENKRLYYVGMTRAKTMLYVPKFAKYTARKDPKTKEILSVSKSPAQAPLGDFIYDALQGVTEEICVLKVGPILEELKRKTMEKDGHLETEKSEQMKRETEQLKRLMLPLYTKPGLLPFPSQLSFTRLNHVFHEAKNEDEERGHDEMRVPFFPVEQEQGGEATEAYLEFPKGAAFGSALHEILQRIEFQTARGDWKEFATAENTELVERYLGPLLGDKEHEEKERVFRDTLHMLFLTLNTPLWEGGVKLAFLEEKIAEMKFYFPYAGENFLSAVGEEQEAEGYLTGSLDLVFEHEGKYYLLDWKSNYIPEGYSQGVLLETMDKAGYDLQAQIYALALDRYLRFHKKDYAFTRHFGGVFYLFLRGIKAGSRDGIFRAEIDLKTCEQVLVDKIKEQQKQYFKMLSPKDGGGALGTGK